MVLTEYILAVTLTALIFVACLALLPSLWLSQTQGLHRMEAGQMAQSLIEQQSHRNLQELRGLSRVVLPSQAFADQGRVEGLLEVWAIPGCGGAALGIRVTLTWREGRRGCRTFRETTVTTLNR